MARQRAPIDMIWLRNMSWIPLVVSTATQTPNIPLAWGMTGNSWRSGPMSGRTRRSHDPGYTRERHRPRSLGSSAGKPANRKSSRFHDRARLCQSPRSRISDWTSSTNDGIAASRHIPEIMSTAYAKSAVSSPPLDFIFGDTMLSDSFKLMTPVSAGHRNRHRCTAGS